jgi:anti-sigma B factor antagonist
MLAKRVLTESSFSMTLVQHEASAIHVSVAGDLDIAAAPEFESTLVATIDDGARHIVVDLTGAQVVDSTGLTSLLRLHRRLQERGGTFHVVCVNARIVKLFTITGLVRVLSIVAINPLEDTPLAS